MRGETIILTEENLLEPRTGYVERSTGLISGNLESREEGDLRRPFTGPIPVKRQPICNRPTLGATVNASIEVEGHTRQSFPFRMGASILPIIYVVSNRYKGRTV